MKVYCFCGKKLAEMDNGDNNEYAGVCPLCLETNDATKSPYYKEPKPVIIERKPEANIVPIKTKADKKRERK